MEVVLRAVTPEGVSVVLTALVYAKILEKHPQVADPKMIARTVREPSDRRVDPLPWREQFLRRERASRVVVVVDYADIPAIIVTVFDRNLNR